MVQLIVTNRINRSIYKLWLIFIGLIIGCSGAQAQNTSSTDDATDTQVIVPLWKKMKMERRTTWALKTNLLYAATLTPNLGLEIGIAPRISLNITGGYNPWNRKGRKGDNDKLVHWLVQPEVRYWFCETSDGHFVDIHGVATKYNIGGYRFFHVFEKNYRYEGWGAGLGVGYGYSWVLSDRWGIEAYLGAGVVWLGFDKTDNRDWCCGKSEHSTKTYFGPTQVGVSLIYNIK